MSKPVFSVRLDPELLQRARELDVDLSALLEASLAKAVKSKRCPYCGSKVKKLKEIDLNIDL